jgi:hypothetical protein
MRRQLAPPRPQVVADGKRRNAELAGKIVGCRVVCQAVRLARLGDAHHFRVHRFSAFRSIAREAMPR